MVVFYSPPEASGWDADLPTQIHHSTKPKCITWCPSWSNSRGASQTKYEFKVGIIVIISGKPKAYSKFTWKLKPRSCCINTDDSSPSPSRQDVFGESRYSRDLDPPNCNGGKLNTVVSLKT